MKELKEFIERTFGYSDIVLRERFIKFHQKNESYQEVAKELAASRVKNIYKPHLEYTPFYGEIEFEKRRLQKDKHIKGILYDGLKLLFIYTDLIPPEEDNPDMLHIVITDLLFGTFSVGDGRYHIRSIISSDLSLISASGIVEGPAKPRIFYKLKQQSSIMGLEVPIEVFKEQIKGQFIDYDDSRITEVVKGYISQVLFFHLTGDPFCEKKDCRLFNAHWQSEVIKSQLESGEFCKIHKEKLKEIKK